MTGCKPWKIEPVVFADAPAIARNNMSAFWEDKSWRRCWDDTITVDYLIEQKTNQIPDDLLYRRDVLRHLKAVDPDTGKLVGYLRLALPVEHATTPDGAPVWPEVQVADVSPEEKKRIQEVSDKAWFEPHDDGSEKKAFEMQAQILSQGIYIRLRYLAVHPESQRKGVGQALVKFLVDKANDLGIDIYVMAYEAGRPVYEKLGFREIDRTLQSIGDNGKGGGKDEHAICFMVYDAKKYDDNN